MTSSSSSLRYHHRFPIIPWVVTITVTVTTMLLMLMMNGVRSFQPQQQQLLLLVRSTPSFRSTSTTTMPASFSAWQNHSPFRRKPLHQTTPTPTPTIHSHIHCRLYSSAADDEGDTNNNNNEQEAKNNTKKVVFLGTPEVAATSLRKLYEHSLLLPQQQQQQEYEISCVITQPPKRRKRKGPPEPSPVGKVAEELGLPVLCPEKANDRAFLDQLEKDFDIRPDLCVTAAYGQYLPSRFLATPTLGTVNIHPSLLPRWRGASPVQRALEAGDNPVGVTVLYTVSQMDAGPIIAQHVEPIDDDTETATTVLPRLFDIGTDLLLERLPAIFNGSMTMDTAQKQDDTQVVSAAMIDPAEAELKPWQETARQMHNKLRGFSMWPGVFLYLTIGDTDVEPVKYKLLETRVLERAANADADADDDAATATSNATTIITDEVMPGPTKKDGLRLVSAVDGSILEILRLQPATKKPVDALSFVNGLQGRTVRYVRLSQQEQEPMPGNTNNAADAAAAADIVTTTATTTSSSSSSSA